MGFNVESKVARFPTAHYSFKCNPVGQPQLQIDAFQVAESFCLMCPSLIALISLFVKRPLNKPCLGCCSLLPSSLVYS